MIIVFTPTTHVLEKREFIGRAAESRALRRELDRERPSIVVLLGRRRVGKSRLLMEGIDGRPSIYYQATKVAGSLSLALFKKETERALGSDAVLASLGDWLGVLAYLEQVASTRMPGLTVVLDEFPYLCEADPTLLSVFQKACDGLQQRGSSLNLVICGSKISFMEELLGEKNPMHGRQTFQLDLAPLPFREAALFFPDWSPEDRLMAYGIFGGIPYYLNLCDPKLPLRQNVFDLVLSPGAPLSDEPNNLLQAELRDVTRYATILRAVAAGCTTSGDIIGRVQEIRDASALAPYVRKLQELRLIRIVRSLDATERERDRRYYLDDPFLAFWYRFVLPNASPLAAGHAEDVWTEAVEPFLDDYMGGIFEWICRDYVRLYGPETLPRAAREIGQIWGADYDIDVAGRMVDSAYFSGECKWWNSTVGKNILEDLEAMTRSSSYYTTRKGEPYYLLFSRSGFTEEVKQLGAEHPRIRLAGPIELLGLTDAA